MAQVTIEGSKVTPTTFLKPGARITVERTPYINRLISRGYVNLVSKAEPIHESEDSIMNGIAQEVDEQRKAAAREHSLTGAPARNALTDDWRAFLTSKGFDVPEAATRADMINAWEASQRTDNGAPVD